jgi:hypothetical protein
MVDIKIGSDYAKHHLCEQVYKKKIYHMSLNHREPEVCFSQLRRIVDDERVFILNDVEVIFGYFSCFFEIYIILKAYFSDLVKVLKQVASFLVC